MAWTHVAIPGRPSVWELRRDGIPNRGMLSFDLDDADHPTVLARHVVAALNDFALKMPAVGPAARWLNAGWASREAYAFECAVNRLFVVDQPLHVREQINRALRRAMYPTVLTPAQMREWQSTIDVIIDNDQIDGAA